MLLKNWGPHVPTVLLQMVCAGQGVVSLSWYPQRSGYFDPGVWGCVLTRAKGQVLAGISPETLRRGEGGSPRVKNHNGEAHLLMLCSFVQSSL